MFVVHYRVHTFSVAGSSADIQKVDHHRPLVFNSSLSCSSSSSSSSLSLQLSFRERKSHGIRSILISCKASPGGNSQRRSGRGDERNDEYIEATVLISETSRHYQLRKQGYVEEEKKLFPFSKQTTESRINVRSIGQGFLRRFQSPTIFLKVACDGDYLLPIIVGELAIEKLIDASREKENRDFPSQFQFMKNLIEKLGYDIEMVQITERVISTYYARIFFRKPGEKVVLSVDACPSDAINLANRCKVPIYINKQIVMSDAIKIVYGGRRGSNLKPAYDVFLDSAAEGPDILSEELGMVTNMNIAAKEERYEDAAMWRDKLRELCTSRYEI